MRSDTFMAVAVLATLSMHGHFTLAQAAPAQNRPRYYFPRQIKRQLFSNDTTPRPGDAGSGLFDFLNPDNEEKPSSPPFFNASSSTSLPTSSSLDPDPFLSDIFSQPTPITTTAPADEDDLLSTTSPSSSQADVSSLPVGFPMPSATDSSTVPITASDPTPSSSEEPFTPSVTETASLESRTSTIDDPYTSDASLSTASTSSDLSPSSSSDLEPQTSATESPSADSTDSATMTTDAPSTTGPVLVGVTTVISSEDVPSSTEAPPLISISLGDLFPTQTETSSFTSNDTVTSTSTGFVFVGTEAPSNPVTTTISDDLSSSASQDTPTSSSSDLSSPPDPYTSSDSSSSLPTMTDSSVVSSITGDLSSFISSVVSSLDGIIPSNITVLPSSTFTDSITTSSSEPGPSTEPFPGSSPTPTASVTESVSFNGTITSTSSLFPETTPPPDATSILPPTSGIFNTTSVEPTSSDESTIPSVTTTLATSSTSTAPHTISATGTDSATSLDIPTSIFVAPTPTPADTVPTAEKSESSSAPSGIPTYMPRLIQAPGGLPSAPQDMALIQLGFDYSLNYPFVVGQENATSQIFAFLPQGVAYGLNIPNSQVVMNSLMPYDTSKALGYITTLAQAYIPTDMVTSLEQALHAPNGRLYSSPDISVRTIMSMINPTIPLLPGAALFTDSENAAKQNPQSGASTSPNGDGGPIGGDSGSSQEVKGSTVGISIGAVAGAAVYAAAMVYVARRYRRNRRQRHQRTPSAPMAERGMSQLSGGGMGSLFMSGANGRFSSSASNSVGSRNSGHSSNGRSVREQGISNPIMSENSLGWH